MITYWTYNNGFTAVESFSKNDWISVTNPTEDEIEFLTGKLKVPPEELNDILDVDERARSEMDESWFTIIIRIPVANSQNGIPYTTVPLGILVSNNLIITICQTKNELVPAMLRNKKVDFNNKANFIMQIFLQVANLYMHYLKLINIQVGDIEKDLEKSTKNEELHKMLRMEKCLVYFMTSLRSNDILIAKLRNSKYIKALDLDEDLVEDVIIENRQAIEMANIYSDIQSGMMDAFASVISNNLNVVMKQVAIITIILMIPTFIASLYGMNVPNNFENNPWGFALVVLMCLGAASFGVLLFRRKNWF
ncbi:MAG TPA: magnesium transporter CorA family protein [Bacteroidales bacterium]|nr:magnesium transporter CorA family protein [Bacteroidales bacterium]